jgi:hypothetical protein
VLKSPSLLANKVSLGVVAGSTQQITKIITAHSTSGVPLNLNDYLNQHAKFLETFLHYLLRKMHQTNRPIATSTSAVLYSILLKTVNIAKSCFSDESRWDLSP